MKTTRYGLGLAAGGWDNYSDPGTDAYQGNHGNILNTSSCALTVSAEAALAASLQSTDPRLLRDVNQQLIPGKLKPQTLLRIVWPGTHLVQYREFADRAPEYDERCDLFYPIKDDPTIPDHGQVSVC